MTIRKATDHETEKIVNHALEVLKESTMGHVVVKWEKVLQLISPFLSDDGYYLVHTKNNVVQGWIGVGSTTDIYTDNVVGIIPEIYVRSQYRNQGIAEKLCEEAIRRLKEDGYQKVQLNVFSGNHIKSLYEKLGFEDVSTLMEKNLNL